MKTTLITILTLIFILASFGEDKTIHYKDLEKMSKEQGKEIRVKKVGNVKMSVLPDDKMTYSSLSKYAVFEYRQGDCFGTKTCGFRCGKNYYFIVDIPNTCRCVSDQYGLAILCPDCPSYSLQCNISSSW